MKEYNDRVRLIYRLLSKIYDLMDFIFFPVKSRNPRLGLARAIPNESFSVLDVCCGTGNSLIAIASRNDKNSLTGVDLSGDMLRAAQRKLVRAGIHGASLREMDAASLELGDSSFDISAISLALHEMPEDIFDSVLSEMSRVTKKGGSICIIEWDKPKSGLGALLFGVFPGLFEPKGFREFLKLDWALLLSRFGLTVRELQSYTFSKLIIADKR